MLKTKSVWTWFCCQPRTHTYLSVCNWCQIFQIWICRPCNFNHCCYFTRDYV